MNSDQHEDSDILTIGDSSESEEWGETDASGRDACLSSSLRCFLNYVMSIIKHNSKTYMVITAIVWKNSGIE